MGRKKKNGTGNQKSRVLVLSLSFTPHVTVDKSPSLVQFSFPVEGDHSLAYLGLGQQ